MIKIRTLLPVLAALGAVGAPALAQQPRATDLGGLLKATEQGDTPTETRAVVLLKKALALDRSLAEPHYQLGSLDLRKGHRQEATQELETACRLGALSSKIHYTLAQAYRSLNRRDDATRELGIYRRLKAEEEKPGTGLAAGPPGTGPVLMSPSRDSKSN